MYAALLCAVLKLTLRLELGAEFDSNANRAELVLGAAQQGDTPTPSFLIRSTARMGVSWTKGRNLFRASVLAGGKIFFEPLVQDQNIVVGQVALEDRIRLVQKADLALFADYYDALQQSVNDCAVVSCDRHRDFRSGSAGARLFVFDRPGELTVTAGWRGFQWKPDPQFDFQGPEVALLATARLLTGRDQTSEVDLSGSYQMQRRYYRGLREVNQCPPGAPVSDGCLAYAQDARADWFQQAGVELTYVGPILVGLSYALQLTSSSSFGQSMLRNLLSLKISARLPWQLYLTLKGQLLANRYLDPVLLDRQVNSQTLLSIEDENRNAFIADLERPIGRSGASIEARYSFFTNELGSGPASFQRHVVFLGASYRWAGDPRR